MTTLPQFLNPNLFLFQKKICINEDAGVAEAVAVSAEAVAVSAEVLVAEEAREAVVEEATRNRRRGGMI